MDLLDAGIGTRMLANVKRSLLGVATAMEITSKLEKRAWRDAKIVLAYMLRMYLSLPR